MPARRLVPLSVTLLLLSAAYCASSAAQDDGASKTRLKLMEQTIARFKVSSDAIRSQPNLTFASQPLLRYSDPTRGLTEATVLLDASLWRLGEKGRPTALVTLEIYRTGEETSVLSYEFASLVDEKFILQQQDYKDVVWEATGSALKLIPLDGAPAPAASSGGRLTQMRQQARRFKVRETLRGGEALECRLLTQPIDRYQPSDAKLSDGAIFAFANGTNPELGLVLECDDKGWSYGAVRLSAAETALDLDGREVASFPVGDFRSKSGVYSANNHPLMLPE